MQIAVQILLHLDAVDTWSWSDSSGNEGHGHVGASPVFSESCGVPLDFSLSFVMHVSRSSILIIRRLAELREFFRDDEQHRWNC